MLNVNFVGHKPEPHAVVRKFYPHALKGQKLLAQGIALGYYGRNPVDL